MTFLKKKEAISAEKKPNYKTNLILDFHGRKYSLHVTKIMDLKLLHIELELIKSKVRERDYFEEIDLAGYLLTDWIADIKTVICVLNRRRNEKELSIFEKQLDGLVSEGKKTELILDSIEDVFGKF